MLGVTLAGCSDSKKRTFEASFEEVQKAHYTHGGPPSLTLFTMVNNKSGSGAHSSLMINGSERVIFDPAGSIRHEILIERQDVIYGVTPRVETFYKRAHARETYHVVVQHLNVSAEQAEMALRLAKARGEVPDGGCASSTAQLLRQIPGFEGIKQTVFPNKLMASFGTIPTVQRSTIYEYDDDDKGFALREYVAEEAAAQQNRRKQ
jgi:hypothetical protein